MDVLVAPNAFKHSLSATQAAESIIAGLRSSAFAGGVRMHPVGDGGDGTAELLRHHLGGAVVSVPVHDPLGRRIDAPLSLVEGGRVAVVEVAAASGLRLLRAGELDPLRATSAGTGDLIRRALDLGASEVLLCIGGSATVDGGAGLLHALGARFLDAAGNALEPLPASLLTLASVDLTRLDARLGQCRLKVLCDVANPLLGERGAARVYGPQKGASAAVVATLEALLDRFRCVIRDATGNDVADLPRGGAAGGIAATLSALLGAELASGIDLFLGRTHFDAALDGASCVITGEGSIDEQTLEGKAPWGVAVRSRARGALVLGVAGQVPLLPVPSLNAVFDALIPICHGPMTPADAIAATAENLRRTARQIGNCLSFAGRLNDPQDHHGDGHQ